MPNLSFLLIDGFWHLALAFWIGGSVVTTFIVAPTVFAKAPSRALAGELVGEILKRQGWLVLGCLLVLAATGGARAALWENAVWPITLRYALLALAILVTGVGITLVDPAIRRLRERLGRPIDEVPVDDPGRQAFRKLHGLSMLLNLVQLILASLVLFLS